MNTNKPSPVNAVVQPLQGQQLPADWQRQAGAIGRQADTNYLERLQNAWKRPMGANAGIMQQARLQNPRQDSDFVAHQQQSKRRHDGHNERFDALELIEERADGWACYRDKQSGTVVWRRLDWNALLGQK